MSQQNETVTTNQDPMNEDLGNVTDGEEVLSLADTWSQTDFVANAKTFFDLDTNLSEEDRSFKYARKDRNKVRKTLKEEVIKYMKQNEKSITYNGSRMIVQEVEKPVPVNKTKLKDIAKSYFETEEQANEFLAYVTEQLGTKVTYELRKEVTEEERVRQKQLRAEERKRKNLQLSQARRRVKEATDRGETPSVEDLALLTS